MYCHSIDKNTPSQLFHQIKLWANMMNFMIQCAEVSLLAISTMKSEFHFSDEDLEDFNIVFSLLEQVKQQMSLLGQNVSKLPKGSCLCSLKSFAPVEDKNNGSRVKDRSDISRSARDRKSKRNACLCDKFADRISRKSRKQEIIICSRMKRPYFSNESCSGCSAFRKELKSQPEPVFEDDDNNPYIIKTKGAIEFLGNGFGHDIFHRMSKYSDKIAQYIEETGESQTFAEMYRNCVSVAVKLRNKGYNEESILCHCATNSKNSSVPYMSGLFIGTQNCALDTSLKVPDMAHLLNMVKPNILFVDSAKIPEVEEALRQESIVAEIVAMDNAVAEYDTFESYLHASDDEIQNFKPYKVDSLKRICIIIFSSGTSGLPKGICLTHHSIQNQIASFAAFGYFGKVFLSFTSLYWISAVWFLLGCILTGATRLIALPFDEKRIYQAIEKFKVDTLVLGSYDVGMFAKFPKPAGVDVSTLNLIATGGGPVKKTTLLELRRKFPGVYVTHLYGQSEGGIVTRFSSYIPEEVALSENRVHSCGRGYGGTWYKVVDETTEKIEGPFQRGELHLKSDSVTMKGYFNKDSSDCFDKYGWLKTGDMVYYDDYHCFYLVDKVKELIKYRGWHVPPTLLENLLTSHPAVSRAVVVGIPHDEDGEHPIGLIIPNPSLDPSTIDLEEIKEFVNRQVDERHQIRAGVRIIETIPMTGTGKVRRIFLRDTILSGEDVSGEMST